MKYILQLLIFTNHFYNIGPLTQNIHRQKSFTAWAITFGTSPLLDYTGHSSTHVCTCIATCTPDSGTIYSYLFIQTFHFSFLLWEHVSQIVTVTFNLLKWYPHATQITHTHISYTHISRRHTQTHTHTHAHTDHPLNTLTQTFSTRQYSDPQYLEVGLFHVVAYEL